MAEILTRWRNVKQDDVSVLVSWMTKFLDKDGRSFFFNSVFHPTKNIPPRLLGETGVRKHLLFI